MNISSCLEETLGSNNPAFPPEQKPSLREEDRDWVPRTLIPSPSGLFGKSLGHTVKSSLPQNCSDSLGQGLVPSLGLSFLIQNVEVIIPNLQASESSRTAACTNTFSLLQEKDRIITVFIHKTH